MGTDDSDDKPTGGAGRETFETVPPELRPYYVPGPSDKIDLTKNPRLAAVRAGLEMLDRMEEAERRAAAAKGSAKAHVAPVAIPQPARPRSDPPAARVEISVPAPALQENKPLAEGQVIQFDRARLAGRKAEQAEASTDEAVAPKDDEPTLQKDMPAASPWTKQAATEDVRASALPSSLRPRELAADGDALASVKPASVKKGGHRKATAAIGIAILVVAVVIGVRALRTPESAAPAATTTAATAAATTMATAAATMPTTVASVEEHAPPVASGTSSAGVAPAASSAHSAPAVAPRPKQRGSLDDPYDAAVAPNPVVTAQPEATVPTTQPTVAPAPPAKTNSPAASPRGGSIPEF